jgi:hypothetical protein
MATRQRILHVRILQMSRVLADTFSARFVLMLWLVRLADIPQAVLRGLARLDDICQAVLRGLARLADIRQAVLRGLARLSKGKFGKFYANLASLANLASVG